MTTEREQFTFYKSFATAISRIKSKAARCDAYDVIVRYALFGEEPDLNKISDSAAIAFDLIKPNLDASRRKAESGKAGGQRKQTESKPQANGKQTASKKENEKENEIEKEKENKCSLEKEKLKESPVPISSALPSAVPAEEKVHLSKQEYEELMNMDAASFNLRIADFPAGAKAQLIRERFDRRFSNAQ